ncbi:MAG TPA: Ku protein [Candidatus Angelobacter sp.]|nr:Ku protein [Candidatus Angelobacter sp.]
MASTVWKGHLTFGLLSLPVKLYSAARGEAVSFNQLHKDDHSRVKQVLYCQLEDKPIQRSDIVKGYEYEKDKYVVIDDEEIKKVAPKTAKTMEVLEFVKASEVDPVYLDASYYLAPDEAGEKPYSLLFEALRQSGCVGVAKIAMHNREHIVILRPGARGILLHTMYYEDEIRQVEEFRTDTSKVQDKELALAKMLIESLLAPFEPGKYKDNYRENLLSMVKAKIEGKEIVEPATPAHKAPVIDILEALKMSLAEGKKPPQSVRAGSAGGEKAELAMAKPKRSRRTSGGD